MVSAFIEAQCDCAGTGLGAVADIAVNRRSDFRVAQISAKHPPLDDPLVVSSCAHFTGDDGAQQAAKISRALGAESALHTLVHTQGVDGLLHLIGASKSGVVLCCCACYVPRLDG
jgi:hypothetical protein